LEGLKHNKIFRVFEQAAYNTRNNGKEGKKLPPELFEHLKNFAGEKELPWFTLTANGVRFHQFVGAIQMGNYCIEILPKIDRTTTSEEAAQGVLIEMLRQSGFISLETPTESNLRLKQNFILEAYIRMFLDETWAIFHRGLVKTYRKVEGNTTTLKGNLLFSQQVSRNSIHCEKFYVRFSTCDKEHPFNRILYKTLKLINKLPVSQDSICSSQTQLNFFPELKDIKADKLFFDKISFNRKTEAYRKAISIARLLLLNYHPDLAHGRNNVLALMFDMNDLWEAWITKRLDRVRIEAGFQDTFLRAQVKKTFWTCNTGERIKQKPDIIIEAGSSPRIILDTKWKIIDRRPSEDDIRQMFAYNRLFGTKRAYLLFPGNNAPVNGEYYNPEENGSCGMFFIPFVEDGRLTGRWVEQLFYEIIKAE
jgi:5-methylcytosine-specific restriction enzyme subunit McrC